MKVFNFNQFPFEEISQKIKSGKKLRFDIGTSINAPVSKFWLDRLTDICVIGIEPNPECVYKENFWNGKYYSIPKVFENHPQKDSYFHIIGACDNVDTLCESSFNVMTVNVGTSSLLEPIFPWKAGISLDKIIKVETFPMKDLLNNIEIDLIELVKIDTQGKDLDIVKSMKEHVQKICYLDLEDDCTKDYKGASSRNEIINYMNNVGFSMYESYGGNLRFKNTNINIPQHYNNLTGDM